jgi:hypothetical protein
MGAPFWSRSKSGEWLIAVPADDALSPGDRVRVVSKGGKAREVYLLDRVDEYTFAGDRYVRFSEDRDPVGAEDAMADDDAAGFYWAFHADIGCK